MMSKKNDDEALLQNEVAANLQNEAAKVNEVEVDADEIAKKLISILVQAFNSKEGRDPDESEMQELLAELTEERINGMLNAPNEIEITKKVVNFEVDEHEHDEWAEWEEKKYEEHIEAEIEVVKLDNVENKNNSLKRNKRKLQSDISVI
jgi:hypothetical protein